MSLPELRGLIPPKVVSTRLPSERKTALLTSNDVALENGRVAVVGPPEPRGIVR
jgi:hypothetical protein